MLSNDKNLSLLLCKAERLRGLVEELIADIRVSPGDTVDKKLCDLLGPSLALLGKMLIKDMHQKAGEIVFKKENSDFEVLCGNHGPDLQDQKGGLWEHKESICRGPKYCCNFNFPVSGGSSETDRRKKLLESIREKTANGGIIMQVKNVRMELQQEYKIDHELAMEYFSRIRLGDGKVHNMGCQRCRDCKNYHRLDAITALQKKKACGDALTEQDWSKALARQSAHCGVVRKK